jgi:hypothetical protein
MRAQTRLAPRRLEVVHQYEGGTRSVIASDYLTKCRTEASSVQDFRLKQGHALIAHRV